MIFALRYSGIPALQGREDVKVPFLQIDTAGHSPMQANSKGKGFQARE
jgi:hypothetical protein